MDRELPAPTSAEPPRRILFIANPYSRNGGAVPAEVLELLARAGAEIVRPKLASAVEISPAIEAHAGAVDAVAVAGGDGTMNAAATGLMRAGLPLGILPAGTANDLARTLGLPLDPRQAAEVIAAGHLRRIDVGEVNGHPFFNVASLGLSAELAHRLSREAKRRWGRLSYAGTALSVLLRARPFSASIIGRHGTVRVKTLQIAVGNGRYYGGGMAVEENAAIDDRHLDLYSLELKRVWKLLLMLRAFRTGRHGLWQEVRTARATAFEIETRRPRPINTDGELVTFTPALFRVLPAAIRVFVPPPRRSVG